MKTKKNFFFAIMVLIAILTIATLVYAAPIFVLSTTTLSVNEGSTNTFTFQLQDDPNPDTVAIVLVSDDPACTVAPASFSLTTGDYNTDQLVTVTGVDNATYEASPATCTITLTANGGTYVGVTSSVDITIVDDESAPQIIIVESGGTYVRESGLTDTFTVHLSVLPTSNVEIILSPDAQCEVDDSQLTFTSISWNSPKTITVAAIDDLADEANVHICNISLTTLNSATAPEYDAVSVNFVVEVDDDDDTPPGLSFTPTSLTIDEGKTDTFLVKLNSKPSQNVLVRAYSQHPYACSVAPNEFTLTDSSFIVGKEFTVTALWNNSAANLNCTIYVDTVSDDPIYNGKNKTLGVLTYNIYSATATPLPATPTPLEPTATPITPTNTPVPVENTAVPTNTAVMVVEPTAIPTDSGEIPSTIPTNTSVPESTTGGDGTPSIGVIAIIATSAIMLFGAVGVGAYFIVKKYF